MKEHSKTKSRSSIILIWLVFIFLNISLRSLFPYTGLGIIVTLPISLVFTLVITVIYYTLVKSISFFQKYSMSLGIFTIIVVAVINIHFYPQEYRPPVWQQISSYYQTYDQYHQLKYQDIFIPRAFPDFKHSEDKLERYVGALHKYKDSIPYDSTYSIYLVHERRGMKQHSDQAILKSKNEILNKLDTDAEKLFFKILNWRYG